MFLLFLNQTEQLQKILPIHFNCDHLIPVETGLEMKKGYIPPSRSNSLVGVEVKIADISGKRNVI